MSEIDKLRSSQRAAARLAQSQLSQFWNRYSHLPPNQFRDALLTFMPALAERYGEVAAVAAADWYENAKRAATGESSRALLAAVDRDAVIGSTRWAVGDLYGDSPLTAWGKLERSLLRHVNNASHRTVARNVDRDGVSWARVMQGRETCGWCRMLASRGFVYTSAEAAGADHGWGHDRCDCEVVPDFALTSDERAELDAEVDELYDQYQDARSRVDTYPVTDSDVAKEWDRSLIDYSMERERLAVSRSGASSDGTIQHDGWDVYRRDLIDRLENDYPDGYVGDLRMPPRNPTQVPDGWPDDLPRLRAREWNHALYGDARGGGHLHGFGWTHGRPEFPANVTPDWLQTAAADVLRSNAPLPDRGRLYGVIDGIPLYVAVDTRRGVRRVTSIFPPS